jgi:predicted nucleic acid-binding protein
MIIPYIDTSALAKWYLNEARSAEFEAFIRSQRAGAISRLTVLEFRSLLSRRRRMGDFDRKMEERVFREFERDIRDGFLVVHPLRDEHVLSATRLIERLKALSLRSLDALHLAIALDLKASTIATADRVLADAAVTLGLDAVRFD